MNKTVNLQSIEHETHSVLNISTINTDSECISPRNDSIPDRSSFGSQSISPHPRVGRRYGNVFLFLNHFMKIRVQYAVKDSLTANVCPYFECALWPQIQSIIPNRRWQIPSLMLLHREIVFGSTHSITITLSTTSPTWMMRKYAIHRLSPWTLSPLPVYSICIESESVLHSQPDHAGIHSNTHCVFK